MSPMQLTILREKIALCTDFRPEERDLILEALNLSLERDTVKHTYPSKHGPGSTPWNTVAWEVMDAISPGKLDKATRWMLAGMIAGAVHDAFHMGIETGKATKQ